MNKPQLFLLTTLAVVLSGCGTAPDAVPRSEMHTALEYYNSDSLRANTLASCTSASEAEVDANLKSPACKAALLAENHHQMGLGAPR